MNRIELEGCAPFPLAHYLKALGVLRLVAEQTDFAVAGCWERDFFQIHSAQVDGDGLVEFFLRRYAPSPILAPWNGGSGFYSKDNTEAIRAIEKGEARRLCALRECIGSARDALRLSGLKDKPAPDAKESFLRVCRNLFPDAALAWLDAAFVLTDDGAKYPPLLGTGGNDGRLEFTNNFMQRLVEVLDPDTGEPRPASERWLRAALFSGGEALPPSKAPVGQFLPGSAGGANATSGFSSESTVNPWDFILMLEGALLFAAAAVRRLEGAEPGALAYPFCVRQAGIGYGSAASTDEAVSRAEMWLPLWGRPATLPELVAVFNEGRAQVGQRAARNGVDFTRAVVTLGVDRGISAFQRYGFQVRNGLAYFATPLERVVVRRNVRADLLSEVDRWLIRLRERAGTAAKQVPASVGSALGRLEASILDLCKDGSERRAQAVLVALGAAERSLSRSLSWTTGRNDQPAVQKFAPLSGLSPRWLRDAYDGSAEFRLAAALASVNGPYRDREGRPTTLWLRQHLEPVAPRGNGERVWFVWDERPSNDVVWHDGDLIGVLNAIFARRLIRADQAGKSELPDDGGAALLVDVAAFIEGRTDDGLLSDLLWGLSLLDWSRIKAEDVPWIAHPGDTVPAVPSALFSLLRLAFRRERERGHLPAVPAVRAIHRLAAAGNGVDASQLSVRRLRSSGLQPAVSEVTLGGIASRRVAAALAMPLSAGSISRLAELILKPQAQGA